MLCIYFVYSSNDMCVCHVLSMYLLLPTVILPHPSMQPTPEATAPPHDTTQSTPGTVPVSSSTHQPTDTFPSDGSTLCML